MAREVSGRYENALLYGPGMAVGRYPEQSANTLPLPVQLPVITPMPLPNGGVVAYPTPTTTTTAGSVSPAASNALLDAAGAGAASMAPSLVNAAVKAAPWMAEHGAISGQDLPGSPGLAPGDTVPAVDVNANYGAGLEDAFGSAARYVLPTPDLAGGLSAPPVDVVSGFGAGVDEAFGAAAMQSAEGGVAAAPTGGGAFGSFDTGLGFNFNPLQMGAGMVGSLAGGYLAQQLVDGDPEQQGMASSIGGTVGGALGGVGAGVMAGASAGSVVPVIGTAIGALIGALAGGTLFGGEPDYPYAWAGYTVDPNSGALIGTGADAMNHATARPAARMGDVVNNYLLSRAQQEGMMLNPERSNYGYQLGFYGKDHDLFYDTFGGGNAAFAGQDQHQWTGQSIDSLGDSLYGTLVGQGYFVPQGQQTASWGQVNDFIGNTVAANPLQAADYGGDMAGTTFSGYTPQDVYWGMQPAAPVTAADVAAGNVSFGNMG